MKRAANAVGWAVRGALVAMAALAVAGCAAAGSPAPGVPAAPIAPVATADVEIRDATTALVGGKAVAFDGVAEGLAWPALAGAVHRSRSDHSPLVVSVDRAAPLSVVLRAVWTLRDADVRVQTADAHGEVRVLDLRPRSEIAGEEGCHLAVFVAANGDLRVAAPGGPRAITGPDAPRMLAKTLARERVACPIRYVAFGADAADAPWARVFDVASEVDRDRSAGDARYVLAEPLP